MTDYPATEPSPKHFCRESSLDLAHRRKINDQLPPGFACAVLHPPADQKGRAPRPGVVIQKLPRGTKGRGPCRGTIFPPPPAFASFRPVRVSKHAKQRHRDGKFGKKALTTLALKRVLLWSILCYALAMEELRRRFRDEYNRRFHRPYLGGQGA